MKKYDYTVRDANESDIQEIVRVTNKAYVVEHFCIPGDRTDETDVRSHMQSGKYLVVTDSVETTILRGVVYMSMTKGRGYFGPLSVDPEFQGKGIAKILIDAVEDQCRLAGCRVVDITVVSLRKELFPFYAKLGYAPSAILPFSRPAVIIQPLHLVQMTKEL